MCLSQSNDKGTMWSNDDSRAFWETLLSRSNDISTVRSTDHSRALWESSLSQSNNERTTLSWSFLLLGLKQTLLEHNALRPTLDHRRDIIKLSSVKGYYKNGNKPTFDQECSELANKRKREKLHLVQNPNEQIAEDFSNVRRDTCRMFRKKKRDYMKAKVARRKQ